MLYFVGLGLANVKDVSVRGLEYIKSSEIVFLESYTNLFESSIEEIKKFIQKDLIVLKRKDIEENYERILELAKEKNVCILTYGEPFFATTHIFLRNEALKRGIRVKIAHSSSIFSSIFSIGISSYKVGKVITIPLKSKISDLPKSLYDAIKINKENNLHTVCLLDIDVENNEFLEVSNALKFLLELENNFRENVLSENDFVAIVSRLGYEDEKVYFDSIKNLMSKKISLPAVIILLSKLSSIEKESLEVVSEKV